MTTFVPVSVFQPIAVMPSGGLAIPNCQLPGVQVICQILILRSSRGSETTAKYSRPSTSSNFSDAKYRCVGHAITVSSWLRLCHEASAPMGATAFVHTVIGWFLSDV